MTNEEAIRVIEVAKAECEWSAPLDYQTAFDMAIEALKEQSKPSTEIQEIVNYLDTTLHPIVSPDNWYVYAELHDMVSMLPSAQPERETGKWMLDNNNYYEERYICSQCGVNYKVDTCMGKPAWSFCPNCGADMRGETDG